MRLPRFLLSLVLIVFLLPTITSHPILEVVPRAQGATRSITLYAFFTGWNYTKPSGINPTITVTQGDTLSFKVINNDTLAHLLLIDFDGNGVTADCPGGQDKCSGSVSGGGGTGLVPSFTVTSSPGSYFYYCLYHSPAYMTGKLIVQGRPDYAVSSNPSSLTIIQGANSNSTMSITSLNGFTGQLSLSATTPPSWSPPFFGTNPVTVMSGMTTTSKLTIYVPNGATPGPYTVTVTATNSSTTHSTNIAITVPSPSYSITAAPSSLTIMSGSQGTSTLTVTGSYGFSGTIDISTNVPSSRGTAIPNPTSVTLSPTTISATSILSISSALGTFNATVIATSGSVTQSTKVLVNGPDFTITSSPTSLSLNQGSSMTLVVTVSGVNGFSGSVSLSANPSNGGLTASFSSNTLQVPATGTVTSTLTVTASSSGAYSTAISPGSYTIALNATIDSLSHSTSIPLTVTSPPFGAGVLTSPLFIGGIVGTIIIVGIAAYVLSRRAKRPNAR